MIVNTFAPKVLNPYFAHYLINIRNTDTSDRNIGLYQQFSILKDLSRVQQFDCFHIPNCDLKTKLTNLNHALHTQKAHTHFRYLLFRMCTATLSK